MRSGIRVPCLWALAAGLLWAGAAWAQGGGRVRGRVVDEAGQPLADVAVTISSEFTSFRETTTTNAKGSFVAAFVDATEPYVFRFEKEGYVNTEAVFKPKVRGNVRQEFVVPSLASQGVVTGGATEPVADGSVGAFNEGVVAAKGGDYELAETKFQQARKKAPKRPEPYVGLASVYLDQKRFDEAAAMVDQALELEPGNVSALLVLYDVRQAAGDDAGVAAALERLRAAGGGKEAAVRAFNAGVKAARAGNVEAGLDLFREALELDPGLAAAHGATATIHLGRGEPELALAAADAALTADPSYTHVLQVKYDAQRALGDEAGAAETLQAMSTTDPAGTAKALYEKGKQLFDGGHVREATAALEQAIVVQPDHARAHYVLGLCYFNANDTAKAKEHLGRFLELAPDDPETANAKAMLEYAG